MGRPSRIELLTRALARLGAVAFWSALAGAALAGLVLSAVAAYLALFPTGPAVARALSGALAEVLAGRATVEGVAVLPSGGIEIRGLALRDPDGHLVVDVPRARVFADVTRLSRRRLGVEVELDGPTVAIDVEESGEASIARAFAAPRETGAAGASAAERELSRRLRIELTRLALRGGAFRLRSADGSVVAEATGIDVDGAGAWDGARAAAAELRLRGTATAPAPGPLALEAAVRLDGDLLVFPLATASVGDTAARAIGTLDVRTLAFRAALLRLGLDAAEARRLAGGAAPAADVAAAGYAESDGAALTAAVDVPPSGEVAPSGTARAAIAMRLDGRRPGVGLDLALASFDPSRVLAQAPPGRIDLRARGALAGRSLGQGRARIALELAPSRVRGGTIGPLALDARADRGVVDVERLEARIAGASVAGHGRWRERGAVAGELAVDATDVAAAARELSALAGIRLPRVGGRLVARASLAGTGEAPSVTARIEAPRLGMGSVRAEAVRLDLDAPRIPDAFLGRRPSPPPGERGQIRISGSIATLDAGGAEVKGLTLAARLEGGEAEVSLTGTAPALGRDPLALEAAGRLSADRRRVEVSRLALAWPRARYALVRPATVALAPLAVDRLELANGERALALSGGLAPRDAIDARLEVTRFDLSTLPAGLLASTPSPPQGELTLDARATGPSRSPALSARLSVVNAGAAGLTGLAVVGDGRWDGKGRLVATVGLKRAEGGTLDVAIDAPLPLASAPAAAPVSIGAIASGWPLDPLWRAAGVDVPVAGTLGARAKLSGTAARPLAEGAVTLDGATVAGVGPVAASATLSDPGDAVRATAEARLDGAPTLEGEARAPLDLVLLLRRPSEALRALEKAPLDLSASLTGLDLAKLAGKGGLPRTLAGTLAARLAARGTPTRPEVKLDVEGRGLAVNGRPVGELDAALRAEAPSSRADVSLRSAAGGSLAATLALETPRGLADPAALADASATLRVKSDALDLGFLPAVLPGIVRAASGRLTADLAGDGPLRRLRPRGKVALEKGRLAVAEVGDWSEVELAAAVGEDDVEISKLSARRGKGRISGRLAAHGVFSEAGKIDGRLALSNLTLSAGGADLATLDFPAEVAGTIGPRRVDATVTVGAGTVQLPRNVSATLQPLDERKDIVEADVLAERARRGEVARAEEPSDEPPRQVRVRVVVPGKLVVKAERPAMNLELRADVTFLVAGGPFGATGTAEVVRGTVEPIAARVFLVDRARVTFPGGPVGDGTLDVIARYDNPAAVVTVTVTGTIDKPVMPPPTSVPEMDQATIAMLIATGRTEVNLNTTGVGTFSAQEAGAAVASAAISSVFTGLVADKLPVDQLSVDTSRIRAGRYVGDDLWLGYSYRFDAKPENYENVNEVRAEYRIAQKWKIELRWGDANSGDAGIFWSTDY